MRGNLLLAAVGSVGVCLAGAVPAHPADRVPRSTAAAQAEIEKIERDRNAAILAGDAAALERMTADDYTFVTQRGELRTKAEIVAGFRAGSFRYSARDVSDLVVRVYGDTAIVTGRARQAGTENRKDYSGENRFTRVYVRQDGRWTTVALQVTLVEKP